LNEVCDVGAVGLDESPIVSCDLCSWSRTRPLKSGHCLQPAAEGECGLPVFDWQECQRTALTPFRGLPFSLRL